jgi:hypothetical protein
MQQSDLAPSSDPPGSRPALCSHRITSVDLVSRLVHMPSPNGPALFMSKSSCAVRPQATCLESLFLLHAHRTMRGVLSKCWMMTTYTGSKEILPAY